MLSLLLALDAAERFLESLKLIHLAESLGGVETLAELPAKMTHCVRPVPLRHSLLSVTDAARCQQNMPEAVRLEHGITPNLIRVSVGIEDVEDLIADLDQALNAAMA